MCGCLIDQQTAWKHTFILKLKKSVIKAGIFLPLFLELMNMVLICVETEDGEQMGFLAAIRQA